MIRRSQALSGSPDWRLRRVGHSASASTVPMLTRSSAVVRPRRRVRRSCPVTPCRLLDTRQGWRPGRSRVDDPGAGDRTVRCRAPRPRRVGDGDGDRCSDRRFRHAVRGRFGAAERIERQLPCRLRRGELCGRRARRVRRDRDLRVGVGPRDHRRRRRVRRHGRSGLGRQVHSARTLAIDRHRTAGGAGIRAISPFRCQRGVPARRVGARDQRDGDRCRPGRRS